MNRYILIGYLLLMVGHLPAQMLEKVLKQHYTSVGQPTLDGIRSMQMDVTEVDGFGMGGKYMVTKKRPMKIKKEGKIGMNSFVMASDGHVAWMIDSMEKNLKPVPLNARMRNILLLESSMGSPLSFSNIDSTKIKYMGIGYIGKVGYYLIRMEMGTNFVTDFFIDKKDGLIHQMQTYQDAQYKKIDVVYVFANYQNLAGIKLPYRWSRTENGNTIDVIVGEVRVDIGAANGDFVMPVD